MPDRFFPTTASHVVRFGDRSVDDLRQDAAAATGPASRWLTELADHLELAGAATMADVPAGWGWTIAVPDDAEQPAEIWRMKHGHRSVGLLRVLRDATAATWTDAAAEKIADLGNALERDGYDCLNDAPADWYWVPGGRP